jgi:hypothetical protein
MKRILLQVDTDRVPSTFDTVAAYDADVDVVVPYAAITPETAVDIAQGAIFTRGGEGLKSTAIFVGGRDVAAGEQVLKAVKKAFFGPFKVSVMLDSNGCNTTAAAAVAQIVQAVPVRDQRVVVTGTGPVGTRVAGLLAQEGAHVLITTIREDWLEAGIARIADRFGAVVEGRVVANGDVPAWRRTLEDAAVLFGASAQGVCVVPRAAYKDLPALRLIADVNLVPPAGIEGVEPGDALKAKDGKFFLGPIGVGNFKMKVHRAAVRALFETNSQVMDAEAVYGVAKGLLVTV